MKVGNINKHIFVVSIVVYFSFQLNLRLKAFPCLQT
uniref:Uncharacterized protein n=1 Tax=Rhizophora mucronata TaxID=61149 RepID=A0A2P2IV33_RHIMU